jgi:FAD/FMN-containing dehydrogenase
VTKRSRNWSLDWWSRRDVLAASVMAAIWPADLAKIPTSQEVLVNDVQTELNPTRVSRILAIRNGEDASRAIRLAGRTGRAVSICGARHASGGQQFGTDTLLLDVRSWNQVLEFDRERGLIKVAGGIEWPDLMAYYLSAQKGEKRQWGIAQKQGGLDGLTIGGTVSANAHGHTLTRPPIVADVESLELIDSSGQTISCSRDTNSELFGLAIGGYGLFGMISSVTLRLVRRRKLRRNVSWAYAGEALEVLENKSASGALYGDFQYSIDDKSPDFMNRGLVTTYETVDSGAPADDLPNEISAANLERLLLLGHTDKSAAFRAYAEPTLASSGEIVWSDTHQYSPYPRGYHHRIDRVLHARYPGSDPLIEVYVPRSRLVDFLSKARQELLERKASVIYGTVRLIRRDGDTFLAWANQDYACVIFTLHMDHSPEGIARTSETFRALISLSVSAGGSYYLTYNRFADRKLLESAYPQFSRFLELKTKYDPTHTFQTDWYRCYAGLTS